MPNWEEVGEPISRTDNEIIEGMREVIYEHEKDYWIKCEVIFDKKGRPKFVVRLSRITVLRKIKMFFKQEPDTDIKIWFKRNVIEAKVMNSGVNTFEDIFDLFDCVCVAKKIMGELDNRFQIGGKIELADHREESADGTITRVFITKKENN